MMRGTRFQDGVRALVAPFAAMTGSIGEIQKHAECEVRPWFFPKRIQPMRQTARDHDQIREYREQDVARQRQQVLAMQDLVIKYKQALAERDLAELDKAKQGVDLALLRKSNEALRKEKELQLLDSRMKKVLQKSATRSSEIAFAIKVACPTIDSFDARELAFAIDNFEDYKHPEKLKLEIEQGELRLYHGTAKSAWRIRYSTFARMDKAAQHSLEKVLKEQIEKQKKLFFTRSTVASAFEGHFSKLQASNTAAFMPPSTLTETLRQSNNQLKLRDNLVDDVINAFVMVFQDLEEQGIDVEKVLLDSWQPLAMQEACWALAYLRKLPLEPKECLEAAEAVSKEDRSATSLAVFELWKSWQSAKNAAFDRAE